MTAGERAGRGNRGHSWTYDHWSPQTTEAADRGGDARPIRPVSHRRRRTVGGGGAGERRSRRGLPLWQELPLLLVIAFCLALLVRTFLLQAFFIPSGSMEETLVAGDRVLVNKVIYQFREPARGEVVVFEGTDAWAPLSLGEEEPSGLGRIGRFFGELVGMGRPGAKDFIKRVIALPGDTVACCDVEGRVLVNGQPLEEEYIVRDSPLVESATSRHDCRRRQFDEVVVRPGHMFVMGDHRLVSQDSRCQGQVPIDHVIGRAFVIVWPSDRWTGLSQPDTFAAVPAPSTTAAFTGAPAGRVHLAGPDRIAAGAGLGFFLPMLVPFTGLFMSNRRVPGSSGSAQVVGSRSD